MVNDKSSRSNGRSPSEFWQKHLLLDLGIEKLSRARRNEISLHVLFPFGRSAHRVGVKG